MRRLALVVFGFSFLHTQAMASGLDDLKRALNQLQGKNEIKAELVYQYKEIRDEGERVRTGNLAVQLEDDVQGLRISYDKDVLQQAEQEAKVKNQDEESDTPVLNAMDRLSTIRLSQTLSAANRMLRQINNASFIGERAQEYAGETLRVLSFDLPLEMLIDDKKVRGYVKDFDGKLDITIDKAGIPLKSEIKFKGKGRAYIVLSMKAHSQATTFYQRVGERLLIMHHEFERGYESTFGEGITRGSRSLQLLEDKQLASTH